LPGILPNPTLTRRRVVQAGAAAALAALTGSAAIAVQDGAEYTFIVAGLDYREGFDEHNSDVLMVARVNPGLGTVNSVSIPRDLYVEIPGYGFDKITRAFHIGYHANNLDWEAGAQTLTDTIAQNFGIAVDSVATTAFAGFIALIDTLGGVTVDNPYEVIDAENEAADPGNWTWPAGVQTLDGESALRFVRTRHMDSDDGRVMRQQLVLRAILDQLQQPETIVKVPALVDSLRDAVETNIPADIQATLIAALPGIDPAQVTFTNIADQLVGGTIDSGMWVYQADWATLPGLVEALLAGQ
jgi:polyisoprenyl-teichoic acid--peptidoglycan teichoic acid transferase